MTAQDPAHRRKRPTCALHVPDTVELVLVPHDVPLGPLHPVAVAGSRGAAIHLPRNQAARRLREADESLGAAVIAHGAVGVADHTLRPAQAREEERRLAASRRPRMRV